MFTIEAISKMNVGKKSIKNLLEISKWIQGPSNEAQIKVYRLGLTQ